MNNCASMLQEIAMNWSRRGYSIEEWGPDWIVVEDENGQQFRITVTAVPAEGR